jgi:peptidoglycan/xylan/chitin deacetylase (PgdA/CDA1 family)
MTNSTQTNQPKYLCLTLDLEKDYGRINTYYSFKNIKPLLELLKKYKQKLTVFVTGEILDKQPNTIDLFKNYPCEFELHSYSHMAKSQISTLNKKQEIISAQKIYLSFFQKHSIGYRAPQGIISEQELEWLKNNYFKYSSSLFPSWRPGLFNNVRQKTIPHLKNCGILEIPFSVVPKLRIPIALSYQQLLGLPLYKIWYYLFGFPNTIVYDFHLYNLDKTPGRKELPLYLQLAYLRNTKNGFKILEKFIKFLQKKSYQSIFMSEIYNLCQK